MDTVDIVVASTLLVVNAITCRIFYIVGYKSGAKKIVQAWKEFEGVVDNDIN